MYFKVFLDFARICQINILYYIYKHIFAHLWLFESFKVSVFVIVLKIQRVIILLATILFVLIYVSQTPIEII